MWRPAPSPRSVTEAFDRVLRDAATFADLLRLQAKVRNARRQRVQMKKGS